MIQDHIGNLNNIVKIGTVSTVNAEARTARVTFYDRYELVSAELKVVSSQPVVTVEQTVDGQKWEYKAQYASAPRDLGLGESYTKSVPDQIELKKKIEYKKVETLGDCARAGKIEEKTHEYKIKVHPWLPYVGQLVLCVFLATGEGDGFVIGGIG